MTLEAAVDKLFNEFLQGKEIRRDNLSRYLRMELGRNLTAEERNMAEALFRRKLYNRYNAAEIYSFHPSRRAAEEFAEELRKGGAVGVRVGKKTEAGFPVFSVVPKEVAKELWKVKRKELKEEADKAYEAVGEKYEKEPSTEPVSEVMAKFQIYGVKPKFTKEQVLNIAKDELRRYGLGHIVVKISRYHGRDPASPYADATVFQRGIVYKIHLHPITQYMDEDEIREVIRHEVETHILCPEYISIRR